jgi:hypothetical protein
MASVRREGIRAPLLADVDGSTSIHARREHVVFGVGDGGGGDRSGECPASPPPAAPRIFRFGAPGGGPRHSLPAPHITTAGFEAFDYEPVANEVIADEIRQRSIERAQAGHSYHSHYGHHICRYDLPATSSLARQIIRHLMPQNVVDLKSG